MTCPTCNGRGKVWHDGITAQFFERCDRCNGTGEIVLRPAAAVPSPEVIAAMRLLAQAMRAIRTGHTFTFTDTALDVVDEYLKEFTE